MSYREKPQLHLYEYKNQTFLQIAIIDDYQEVSFERNLFQAGTFTITINFNIPNSQLFQRGLFVQFGSDPYDFGEIYSINDSITQDGKGGQIRTITGYDIRYIFKRRVIKNMNDGGKWSMTAKGEICMRNLIADQCGVNAEIKRQLPITNTIPSVSDAIGKEYSVSEEFTNLYEVLKTIATQSEVGWKIKFENGNLTLECYQGENISSQVQFSTDFESLKDGNFQDSSESYSNTIYISGKGQNEERDLYVCELNLNEDFLIDENGNFIVINEDDDRFCLENDEPDNLKRFESYDNQSEMTTESEYEAEALSMLSQYGQTIQMSGNGLAKCPYIYKEQYNVGDWITVAFSGKKAIVQILSVTERWVWNSYDIQFSFGKPQNNLKEQLQLILRKIQTASSKTNAVDSVKWYTVGNVTQEKADITFNTLGITGEGGTLTFYLDNEGTGSKRYMIYAKNLAGSVTLTTGISGKSNVTIAAGNSIATIFVDTEGNILKA